MEAQRSQAQKSQPMAPAKDASAAVTPEALATVPRALYEPLQVTSSLPVLIPHRLALRCYRISVRAPQPSGDVSKSLMAAAKNHRPSHQRVAIQII